MNFGDIYCSDPSFSSSSHMCNILLLIPCLKATYSADALECAIWATFQTDSHRNSCHTACGSLLSYKIKYTLYMARRRKKLDKLNTTGL